MTTTPTDRLKLIQKLSAELARVASSSASDQDIFSGVLTLLCSATESLGGAIWLVARREARDLSLKLAAANRIDEAAGHAESAQRQQVLRAASEVILSSQPLVLMPTPLAQAAVTPGILVNFGPHGIVGVPLRSGDDLLGAVQLWFPQQSDPKKLAELALMLQALMTELGPRLRARQMRDLGVQNQRQQQLLLMAQDLIGQLDPEQAARLATAHIRELLAINRVSILIRQGDRWRVFGISGQPQVETRSEPVVRMLKLAETSMNDQLQIITAETHRDYFADSPMQSVALVPVRDGTEGRRIGILLCESADAAQFGPVTVTIDQQSPSLALAQRLADLTGRSLKAALVYQSLPLAPILAHLGHWRESSTKTQHRRRMTWLVMTALILLFAFFWPLKVKIEANCTLLPQKKALITTETAGRVEEILVREGDRVKRDQIIARLDTRRLQSEWENSVQSRKRLEAEAERQRGQGKEALARMATLEAQATAETEKRLRLEIDLSALRSPIDGVVMTKDVHLLGGTFLQSGERLAEVATVNSWDLRLEIAEADISEIESALTESAPREVRYLLYTQSAHPLKAMLESKEQISPALHSSKEGGVFSITLPRVPLPSSLQPLMRPGLTGRAKIELDRRPAGRVLLRKFTRWLQMRWWL